MGQPVVSPAGRNPSRSEPSPLRTAPDHGLSNAGGNVDNKVFIPSSRPQVGAQGAEECLHLLAPHFAHVHEMSFRIKYLCAVAIKPSSNHQKKLANVSIAAYLLRGPAIAPDMWASRKLTSMGVVGTTARTAWRAASSSKVNSIGATARALPESGGGG